MAAAAHACLLAMTCCGYCYHGANSHGAGAFIHSTHTGARQPRTRVVPATDNSGATATSSSLTRIRRTRTTLQLQQQPQQHQHQHQHHRRRRHHHHYQWRETLSFSHARLRALPEDTGAESTSGASPQPAASEAEEPTTGGEGSTPPARGRSGAGIGVSGTSSSSGLDTQFISKLARRMADSFPLLTADEIKSEVRALLNPETKAEANKVFCCMYSTSYSYNSSHVSTRCCVGCGVVLRAELMLLCHVCFEKASSSGKGLIGVDLHLGFLADSFVGSVWAYFFASSVLIIIEIRRRPPALPTNRDNTGKGEGMVGVNWRRCDGLFVLVHLPSW